MIRIAIAVCALFLTAGAHAMQQRGGTPADYAAILEMHDRAVAASNAGDVNAALDFYLDRLRVAHTQSTKIEDKAHLAEEMKASRAKGTPYLVSVIEEMEVSGPEADAWAYVICRYAATTIPTDKTKPIGAVVDGRYIALLERTPQGWKVLLDIDNGAPGAAPDLIARVKKELAAR
jgi:ketosteroid isomerase-like protein